MIGLDHALAGDGFLDDAVERCRGSFAGPGIPRACGSPIQRLMPKVSTRVDADRNQCQHRFQDEHEDDHADRGEHARR